MVRASKRRISGHVKTDRVHRRNKTDQNGTQPTNNKKDNLKNGPVRTGRDNADQNYCTKDDNENSSIRTESSKKIHVRDTAGQMDNRRGNINEDTVRYGYDEKDKNKIQNCLNNKNKIVRNRDNEGNKNVNEMYNEVSTENVNSFYKLEEECKSQTNSYGSVNNNSSIRGPAAEEFKVSDLDIKEQELQLDEPGKALTDSSHSVYDLSNSGQSTPDLDQAATAITQSSSVAAHIAIVLGQGSVIDHGSAAVGNCAAIPDQSSLIEDLNPTAVIQNSSDISQNSLPGVCDAALGQCINTLGQSSIIVGQSSTAVFQRTGHLDQIAAHQITGIVDNDSSVAGKSSSIGQNSTVAGQCTVPGQSRASVNLKSQDQNATAQTTSAVDQHATVTETLALQGQTPCARVKGYNEFQAKLREKKKQQRHEELRLTLSLLVVILVFIVCWLPFCITMFLSVFSPYPVPRIPDMATLLLGFANSCCNPLIYGLMNRTFKEGFQKLFCCKRTHVKDSSAQTFAMKTK